MTKRRKLTTIVSGVLVASIIVVSTYSSFVTTGAELKEKRSGRLPRDIDRLKVTSVYPEDDPNAQEVYFEYNRPSLYDELDGLLRFRTVSNAALNTDHACLGDAMIYFYRGAELCQPQWNFAHGDFFHPGLLTSKSKNKLIEWFKSKGFAKFAAGQAEWQVLQTESDANMVVD